MTGLDVSYIIGRWVRVSVTWEPWPGYGDDRVDVVVRGIVGRHITALDRELQRVAAETQLEVTP